jgi:fused signal recognition particle receptor
MSEETPKQRSGFFGRLKERLSKTKRNFVGRIRQAITLGGKVNEDMLDDLEEILIQSDIGPRTSMNLIDMIRHNKEARGENGAGKIIGLMKEGLLDVMGREPKPLAFEGKKPFVVLVVGVNGTGKTTTIGKIAQRLAQQGKKATLVAGDTFRAAAIDQLEIWAERTGSQIIKQAPGADPASVCYDAMQSAMARDSDVILIDTAGRLHTKVNLMEELKKVVRVIKKHDETAPHETILVLDATTGQNALSQAQIFSEAVNVTGLVMTKLDGTAKGGILIALCDQFKIPIRMIGVGEGADDYRDFSPVEFVDALFEE